METAGNATKTKSQNVLDDSATHGTVKASLVFVLTGNVKITAIIGFICGDKLYKKSQ